ncbi:MULTISPECIES: apolipoprotein N-acyltransferase [Campylobacter]|uniref:apolipoprotein N-acyltransferase n=1 Tax=Campylobacter molothri TaxID=1032242 RepID=UPI001D9A6138|nr:apolipoprotein N-acyltransferase [Campylobacter sp. RM10542]MBZ7937644.1 apolipoprotein N-acyltransferase [Campylobacter sp. RM10538]MBZ7959250.1 apolipoprotein N-acyltransferase [Campylobacter sp. RM12397]
MKLKLIFLPYFSFIPKKLNTNSTIFKIIKVFFVAILLSNPIYLSFFENIFTQTISPFLAIWGLILLLKHKKAKEYFWIGFFTGILWFWWIGLSSIYFNLSYLVPIIIFFVGLFYGLLFRICYWFKFDFLRLCGIFCLSFIHPFGFDWLNWGIFTVYGFFDTNYRGIICIFLIAYFIYEGYISRYYKIAIVLILFFIGLQYDEKQAQKLDISYKLINTNISQDQKFLSKNIESNVDFLLKEIIKAIKENKKLVILPETAFPFDLKNTSYENLLKNLSYQITIITGAFNKEDDHIYNSTYIFKEGNVYILNKHYLVPFGEEIPIFKNLVQKYFLPNTQEFSKGPIQSKYKLDHKIITNAICYEVTKEKNYQNSQIIIAISNNAWFNYSSEYKLQQLLIKFYASKYGVSVYHAVNGKENATITPKKMLSKSWMELFKKIYKS